MHWEMTDYLLQNLPGRRAARLGYLCRLEDRREGLDPDVRGEKPNLVEVLRRASDPLNLYLIMV